MLIILWVPWVQLQNFPKCSQNRDDYDSRDCGFPVRICSSTNLNPQLWPTKSCFYFLITFLFVKNKRTIWLLYFETNNLILNLIFVGKVDILNLHILRSHSLGFCHGFWAFVSCQDIVPFLGSHGFITPKCWNLPVFQIHDPFKFGGSVQFLGVTGNTGLVGEDGICVWGWMHPAAISLALWVAGKALSSAGTIPEPHSSSASLCMLCFCEETPCLLLLPCPEPLSIYLESWIPGEEKAARHIGISAFCLLTDSEVQS